MSTSCINAADVDDMLETNQSSATDDAIPLDEPMEIVSQVNDSLDEPSEELCYGFYSPEEPSEQLCFGFVPRDKPIELVGLENVVSYAAPLLDTSHMLLESTPYSFSETSLSNRTESFSICESVVIINSTSESFSNPHFITYESKLTVNGQCLDHGCDNYAEETSLSDNRKAAIYNDFGDLNSSNDFYGSYANTAILNCIQFSRNIMTMPRNMDEEEEQNFRNSLTVNCNQALDKACKDALIDLREYSVTGGTIEESSDTDLEISDFTLNIEYTYDNMGSWCPDSLNSDNYSLEINDSYYDDISISEDNLEYYILADNSLIDEEPYVSVENMLNLGALTYNTDIIGSGSAKDHCNKITITETLICNNSIFTEDFNQNGESIFNQGLLLLINYMNEDLIEESTPLDTSIEFFDYDLVLSENLLTNFCKAFEKAEPHIEANGDNESLENENSYFSSVDYTAVSSASAQIRSLLHLKRDGNTTAANDAEFWGKTNAEAFKELWDIGENRFCLDILYTNLLTEMINYMGIYNQGENTQ